jgi:hypothetical protein
MGEKIFLNTINLFYTKLFYVTSIEISDIESLSDSICPIKLDGYISLCGFLEIIMPEFELTEEEKAEDGKFLREGILLKYKKCKFCKQVNKEKFKALKKDLENQISEYTLGDSNRKGLTLDVRSLNCLYEGTINKDEKDILKETIKHLENKNEELKLIIEEKSKLYQEEIDKNNKLHDKQQKVYIKLIEDCEKEIKRLFKIIAPYLKGSLTEFEFKDKEGGLSLVTKIAQEGSLSLAEYSEE